MLQRLQRAVGWTQSGPAYTRINFQVSAKLGHGETIYIVGDAVPLGGSLDAVPIPECSRRAQQPSTDGYALATTPELYPIWYNVEPIELKSHTTLKYRYAICSNGKFVRYETIPEPRTLEIQGLEMGTQDILDQATQDALAKPIPMVPRLSSGQAFVDPRAISAATEGSVGRGSRRIFGAAGADSNIDKARTLKGVGMLTPIIIHEDTPVPDDVPARDTIQPKFPLPMGASPVEHTSPFVRRSRSMSDDGPHGVTIESTDTVIFVSTYLPATVVKQDGKWVAQWDDDHLLCPSSRRMLERMGHDTFGGANITTDSTRLTWVGGIKSNDPIEKEDMDAVAAALSEFHCVPVFLTAKMRKDFQKFSRGTLWPVFHNIVDVYGKLPTRWWDPSHQKEAWRSYTDANRIYVNKVIEVYNEGDLIWVHDIDLLLAPSFLSRRLPCANVGLFLHTPFPSSEIFRTLSVREDLLRGMLSADHIGFHLYEYARHFLTSCRRILGLKYAAQPGGYVGVDYNGRTVAVTISHIGLEPPLLEVSFRAETVQDEINKLKDRYTKQGLTLIIGIDPVERLKGISLKLLALEHFLRRYPEWVPKLRLLQFGVRDSYSESTQGEHTERCRREIKTIVTRINDAYKDMLGGQEIVEYVETTSMQLESRIPLWSIADIMFVTSVRDAVNLFPFEFVYSQHLMNRTGVLILSEFSGSSRVLTGSLGVNPWKRDEIIGAIHAALTMDSIEKKDRHDKDYEYILHNTRTRWAERVLIDLKRARRDSSEGEYLGYGLGLGFRMMEFNAGFKRLEIDELVRAYRLSFRRVLLFDFGNTLVNDSPADKFTQYYCTPSGCKNEISRAPEQVLSILGKLCQDPRNTVFVLSGKDKVELNKILGGVKNLGLAAEHGYFYRWGDQKAISTDDWLCTKENFDNSWLDLTHAVMDIYTQRTHGTFIEVKGSALLWQFRDADPEFGQLQAKELHDQLTQVLEHFPVEVQMGNEYLEVRPEGVDKGTMVDRILSTMESTSNESIVDFVLCIGDDKSDEFMFSYLEENELRAKLFTCTVGKKPSAAKYFVNDVEAVLETLGSLTRISTASNRNLSMNDLRKFDSPNNKLGFSNTPSGTGPFAIQDTAQASPISNMKTSKYSMSMTAISSVAEKSGANIPSNTSSSTLEQYFSNFGEEDEEDAGGIFF